VGDATDLALSTITLPVGEVAKLTGHIPNDISDVPGTDSFDAFVLGTPETAYYVVFRCEPGIAGDLRGAVPADRGNVHATAERRVGDALTDAR
jgi:hypothetical protein